ncbi:reverse transcriptase domain-containing protein [Halobacteriovorax sp. DPLXC-1]|uniref:reverse transcriptase domain-containing protein n=1 Tax=Halobacteriovorax sp. DPLXC-1 TaxID=3110771 RepID=UPI002FF145B2
MLNTIFTIDRIQRAIDLIELQQNSGAGSFNNIEYLIYKNCKTNLCASSIYENFVQNNNFYNNHEYLKAKEYNVAKGLNGTRCFHFQERESLVLYSALGLYIQELIKPTFDHISNSLDFKNKVSTYYGAEINNHDIKQSRVTYKEDYNDFLNSLKKYTQDIFADGNNFFVVKIDVKNFYYSIDHSKLIKTIKDYSTKESLKRMQLDNKLETDILDFLYLIMDDTKGLAVSNQNVVSSYIANAFLHKLDDYVYKLLSKTDKEWKYLRYVDDIYILSQTGVFSQEDLNPLIANISFFVANELGLEINSKKSEILHITSSQDLVNFLETSSIVSNSEGKLKLEFNELLNHRDIVNESSQLVKEIVINKKEDISTSDMVLLNKLFLKDVKNILDKEDTYKTILDQENTVETINRRNILVAPKQILNFFNKNPEFIKSLIEFIEECLTKEIIDYSIYHFIEYLLINDMLTDNLKTKILNIKEESSYLSLLKRSLTNEYIDEDTIKLLPPKELFDTIPSLVHQCKYLSLAERRKDYSKCLNHLYNILIEYSKSKYPSKAEKNYNINILIENLGKEVLSMNDIRILKDIAHLRCNNGISHPGENNTDNQLYLEFKKFVNSFINR